MTYIHMGQESAGEKDSDRVLDQAVTGIGFLGAGVIMNKDGAVNGMTSAAVVWLAAAIGAAIGFGHYARAVALSVIDIPVLTGVDKLEIIVRGFQKGIYKHGPRNNG